MTPDEPFWPWLIRELKPFAALAALLALVLLAWAVVLAPTALLIWS